MAGRDTGRSLDPKRRARFLLRAAAREDGLGSVRVARALRQMAADGEPAPPLAAPILAEATPAGR